MNGYKSVLLGNRSSGGMTVDWGSGVWIEEEEGTDPGPGDLAQEATTNSLPCFICP